jgi:hypothetical protein
MTISFPSQNPAMTQHGTVAFQAVVEGAAIVCEISADALQDHFGATTNQSHDLLTAFISGKSHIHDVAREKLPHSAGRCLLVSKDF